MDTDNNRDFLYPAICGDTFRVPVFARVSKQGVNPL